MALRRRAQVVSRSSTGTGSAVVITGVGVWQHLISGARERRAIDPSGCGVQVAILAIDRRRHERWLPRPPFFFAQAAGCEHIRVRTLLGHSHAESDGHRDTLVLTYRRGGFQEPSASPVAP